MQINYYLIVDLSKIKITQVIIAFNLTNTLIILKK